MTACDARMPEATGTRVAAGAVTLPDETLGEEADLVIVGVAGLSVGNGLGKTRIAGEVWSGSTDGYTIGVGKFEAPNAGNVAGIASSGLAGSEAILST